MVTVCTCPRRGGGGGAVNIAFDVFWRVFVHAQGGGGQPTARLTCWEKERTDGGSGRVVGGLSDPL